MTRNQRILKDLTDNLRDKMLNNITDYVSLCRSAELNPKHVMTQLMLTLVRLTASYAAFCYKISPDDFAEVMGRQFECAQQHLDEEEEECG